ncbi:MAG: kynureninase [Acidobacteria bacterium]|nr:kynureninase [Acidobacteriota bacterium]
MTFSAADLLAEVNPLADHYRYFRVGERTLLSGHSHQAWPDCGLEAQRRAWLDAAEHVDDKWSLAFAEADKVRSGYRRLIDDPTGLFSLAGSTHDLLVKLISALPLAERPRLVTTDGEFHSLRRQLDRLAEEGIEVHKVPALPAADVGERLAAAVTDTTSAVFTSTVFFGSSHIAGDLTPAAEACRRHGAILVLDVYHQLNVVPFSLAARDLLDVYVVSAGYKYCQLGEGNAFLRFPRDCELRPVATGWFAEFGQLTAPQEGEGVSYSTADDRFGGATYDPTSHYRAARVFEFFSDHGLDALTLREVSQAQIALLCREFDALDLDPAVISRDRSVELSAIGGFLALTSPHAGRLCRLLEEHGIHSDFRDQVLRLGPAPYLSRRQLTDAVAILAEVVGEATG